MSQDSKLYKMLKLLESGSLQELSKENILNGPDLEMQLLVRNIANRLLFSQINNNETLQSDNSEELMRSNFINIFSSIQNLKSISDFSTTLFVKISQILDLQRGLFYIATSLVKFNNVNDNENVFELVGQYGPNASVKNIQTGISSLINQCILSRKPIELHSEKSDRSSNQQVSTTSTNLKYTLVLPIIYDNKVFGALEVASHLPFSDSQKKLVIMLSEYIGIPIKNISNLMYNQKLLEEKRKTHVLLERQKQALDASALVAETDLQGKITYVNSKFIEISKYSRDELLGRDHNILNSGHHSKEFFIDLWKTIASGEVWRGEIKNRAKDGSFYWVSTTIFPVKDDKGVIEKYIAIRFDISDRKNIEEKLKISSENANKVAQAKADFLANMSHEIRTPLNTVIGLSDILLDTSLSDEQKRYLLTLKDSGETLLSIVNDILDLSKIDSGQLAIEKVAFNLEAQIEQVIEMMANRASEKKLEVYIDMDHNVPTIVNGDPLRLKQILLNLIANAIKFTECGSVSLQVKLVEKNEKSATINFSVTDTGIGIASDNLEKIFNSFEQADSSTTRKFGGTGLGLSIVKRLTEMMGGEIFVDSRLGSGSTFTVKIGMEYNPIYLVKKSNIDYIIENKRILIVDDFEENRLILKKTLLSWGACVYEAKNGNDALQMLNSSDEQFDLVFLDSRMPDLNGFEVIESIRSERNVHDFVVLMLTSDHNTDDLKKAKELGISTYVLKPAKKADLKYAIRRIFKRPVNGNVLLVEDDLEILDFLQIVLEPLDLEFYIAQSSQDAIEAIEQNKIDIVISDYNLADKSLGTEIFKKIVDRKMSCPMFLLTGNHLSQTKVNELLNLGVRKIYSKPFDHVDLIEDIRSCLTGSDNHKLSIKVSNFETSNKLKILVVEDSEKNRQLLKVYFKDTSFDINYAENGKECLQMYEVAQDSYDIILMDMQMPIMDGYQAVKIIREKEMKLNKSRVPIIALTANVLSVDYDRAVEVGCTGYLSKPIKKNDLLRTIENIFKKAS